MNQPFRTIDGALVDAFALEFQWHRDRSRRNKEPIVHRVIERVRIGRNTAFKVEGPVGVAIDGRRDSLIGAHIGSD